MASVRPSQPEPEKRAPQARGEHERFGPVELRRFVKEDGRALLLFTRGGAQNAADTTTDNQ